jgi:hypothetical protein
MSFDASTAMTECFIAFALSGLGMGFISLSTLLVVQSSLSKKDLGVATSSQQFSRTLGGAIGVGIAGAVVTGRLISQLKSAGSIVPQDVMSKVAENIEIIFRHDFFSPLSSEIQNTLQSAVANSVSTVFWIVFAIAILILIFSRLLPKEIKIQQ